MKKSVFAVLLAVLVVLMTAGTVEAKSSGRHDVGLGVVFGLHDSDNVAGDVGLSLKFKNFPVLGLKFALGNNSYFGGTIDYWFINNSLSETFVYWYLGVGGYVWLSQSVELGARLPIGLQFFPVHRLEIFIEVAPLLRILPDIRIRYQGALGIRFYI